MAVGDTILEVNGVRTNPREMLEKLREDADAGEELELLVKSRTEYTIDNLLPS